MLIHRRRIMPELPMHLIYSVRTAEDVIYADELEKDATLTFTREPPADWAGHTGRIDASILEEALSSLTDGGDMRPVTAFICGSNGFVEAAGALALAAGLEPERIRTERFGPSG
jgi:ferredoxin-NADP reductase